MNKATLGQGDKVPLTPRRGRPPKAEVHRPWVQRQFAETADVPAKELYARFRREGFRLGRTAFYELVASAAKQVSEGRVGTRTHPRTIRRAAAHAQLTEVVGAATAGEAVGLAGLRIRSEEDLRSAWKEIVSGNINPDGELFKAIDRVRTATRRAPDKPPSRLNRGPRDLSPHCERTCEGVDGAHRHCAACRRAWHEDAEGVEVLHLLLTVSQPGTYRQKLLARLPVLLADSSVEWTDAPGNSDRLIWACTECRFAAAQRALPNSGDRDVLLDALPPTPLERLVRAPEADPLMERVTRRYPKLWKWRADDPVAYRDAWVMNPRIKFSSIRSGTSGTIHTVVLLTSNEADAARELPLILERTQQEIERVLEAEPIDPNSLWTLPGAAVFRIVPD